jgi:hypothetical protein
MRETSWSRFLLRIYPSSFREAARARAQGGLAARGGQV